MLKVTPRTQFPPIIFEALICLFYLWYVMPIVQALFSGAIFKFIFFSFFMIGALGLALFSGFDFKFNKLTGAILIYFLVLTTMVFLNIGDANAHIRISFTFWGTPLLFFGVLNEKSRIRIGKFILVIFIITCITSSFGVIINNEAARTISHAASDEELKHEYRLMNIGDLSIFQGMILFIPCIIALMERKRDKRIGGVILVILMFVLFNASFTISLIMFLVTIILTFLFKQKSVRLWGTVLFLGIVGFIIYLNGNALLTFLSQAIDNVRLSKAMLDLRNFLYFGDTGNNASTRFVLYGVSFETFLNNPLGIGPHYSYEMFQDGIGYHSQLIDDLARYGLFAIAYYGVFFTAYHKYLKSQWNKLGKGFVATAITIAYLLFLILNLGFRFSAESVTVMFLLPFLPDLIISIKNKENPPIKSTDNSEGHFAQ